MSLDVIPPSSLILFINLLHYPVGETLSGGASAQE